ncbi:methionine--tRNA ligase subunit beta [candidate division bacterium WOR-3 4484_18]|uniref:Methionine--tRNA ligase n=1 Tax=candidate division WOR-3 bacterium 4484_18 TaxID=2020626 RepID=A0A257LXZ0_UNCW3|nr:MAG: methionine--tRNA ligase subunit beta [candidate division bacterium WOR-3 4484_18]
MNRPTIRFDDFDKLELIIAEVLTAERVPGTDKLMQLRISTGADERTIVAGIAHKYTPEEMVGKKIVYLANLAPRKIRGIMSYGMLLAAVVDGDPVLLIPDKDVPAGAPVS